MIECPSNDDSKLTLTLLLEFTTITNLKDDKLNQDAHHDIGEQNGEQEEQDEIKTSRWSENAHVMFTQIEPR